MLFKSMLLPFAWLPLVDGAPAALRSAAGFAGPAAFGATVTPVVCLFFHASYSLSYLQGSKRGRFKRRGINVCSHTSSVTVAGMTKELP